MDDSNRLARLRGLFLGAGPGIYWYLRGTVPENTFSDYSAIGLVCLVMAGGFALDRVIGRLAVAAGIGGVLVCSVPFLLHSPSSVLLLMLVASLVLNSIRRELCVPSQAVSPESASLTLRWMAGGSLVVLAYALGTPWRTGIDSFVLYTAPCLTVVSLRTVWSREMWRLPLVSLFIIPTSVFLLLLPVTGLSHAVLFALAAVCMLCLVGTCSRLEGASIAASSDFLASSPSKMLAVTFLGTCTAGAMLLVLPAASSTGLGVSWMDAFFTSVSATCVTGLSVLDTPSAFSSFGQAVILLLIQVGGLGIMTFSTAALLLLYRRLSVRAESAVSEIVGSDPNQLGDAIRSMLWVTAGAELLGAIVLSALFVQDGDPVGTAVWRGIFTAISAFCNAGFSLQSDSLVSYRTSPMVLHTTAWLIVLGGLGPAVVVALPGFFRRRNRLSLHVRIVVLTTAILLLVPIPLILIQEGAGTLSDLGPFDSLTNAWFQSVTTRTAGFNAVDQGALHPATRLLVYFLMFVGGSPGSTAGGIKTTTLLLLMCSTFDAIRGRAATIVWGWRIPFHNIHRAFSICALDILICGGGTLALLLTQQLTFEVCLFEVVSATGTVGLSIGATPFLDGLGKLIIIACMFAGRVGPVTLALALGSDDTSGQWRYPEQQVMVG